MTRVIVDGDGAFVDYATSPVLLAEGQQIVDLSPADIRRLQAGWTVESTAPVVDRLRAFRDNPRMEQVLALGQGEDLTGNLLRNWAQDVTRFCQHVARDVIVLYRNQTDGTDPEMVEPDEEATP